jgi:hypothetical protein
MKTYYSIIHKNKINDIFINKKHEILNRLCNQFCEYKIIEKNEFEKIFYKILFDNNIIHCSLGSREDNDIVFYCIECLPIITDTEYILLEHIKKFIKFKINNIFDKDNFKFEYIEDEIIIELNNKITNNI